MIGRLTVTVRNTEGLDRRLESKNRNVRRALRAAVKDSGERVYNTALALTPVDTGYMAEKLRLSYHREGYTYHVGWYKEDFAGTMRIHGFSQNPTPRPFYPVYVVYGTSQHAGNVPLTPALEDERPAFRRQCSEAMRTPS